MQLEKKYQCVHCGSTISCTNGVCVTSCSCGKVKSRGEVIVEGQYGTDYVDVSQKLILG
jgi:hypothetical protein